MENKESALKFPCDFPIKVVGKSTGDFESFVYTTVNKHFPQLTESAIQTKPSKDGTYLAITVIVPAISKEQLDLFYKELTSNKEVLFAI